MKRSVMVAITAAVIAAAAVGVVWRPFVSPSGDTKHSHLIEQARAEPAGAAIYYQHPDGKPSYSLTPKKTLKISRANRANYWRRQNCTRPIGSCHLSWHVDSNSSGVQA